MVVAAVEPAAVDAVVSRTEHGHEEDVSPCQAKLNRLPWVDLQTLEIGGESFGVRTTSQSFSDWIRRALPGYVRPGPSHDYYSIYVPNGNTPTGSSRQFSIMYRGTNPALRTGDPLTLKRAFVEEMETFLAPNRTDAIFINASLVLLDGTAVLVTRTAMSLLENAQAQFRRTGAARSTSRWLAVDVATATATPVPLTVKVDPTVEGELLNPSEENPTDGRFVVREPVDVRAVFGLGSSGPLVEPMSKATGMMHLAGHLLNLSVLGRSAILGLGELVSRVPCYRLNIDRTALVADAFFETIGSL